MSPRRSLVADIGCGTDLTAGRLESRRGGNVKTVAFLIIFSASTQVAGHLPVTIEVKRDVEVSHNAASHESHGKLYLGDAKAKAFRLKKGQRFQMVKIGQEGSCWIRFANKEYRLTSCPWLDGFRDHQTEIFSTVTEK